MTEMLLEKGLDAAPQSHHVPLGRSALLALVRYLYAERYHFVTVTPATHRRFLRRHEGLAARTREEVLGWSLPFIPGSIDPVMERLLGDAGMLDEKPGGLLRSRIRVSSVHKRLFVHSAYPTDAQDAIFLGPDSYRFADLISHELALSPLKPGDMVIDMGTGSGVGAVTVADLAPGARLFMTDINARALGTASVNAEAAGHAIAALRGRNLGDFEGKVDLIIANPPYVIDPARRAYRDGGGAHGGEISLEMSRAAVKALAPGGRFILYTGSAIVGGVDNLKMMLARLAEQAGCEMRYREIDPDVFGEELDLPHYHEVDRIAVVAAVMTALC
ncbi:MAG: methyltransferase [Sphingobium sp.]|nr:methyltransferase [Sphingobium sp.]